jgi:hypothetical protein
MANGCGVYDGEIVHVNSSANYTMSPSCRCRDLVRISFVGIVPAAEARRLPEKAALQRTVRGEPVLKNKVTTQPMPCGATCHAESVSKLPHLETLSA